MPLTPIQRRPFYPQMQPLKMSTLPTNILTLFLTFLKSGGLTVGDGYAIIHPLRRAIVETNGWMTADEFAEHLSLVQAMPGIFNVNFATYMGRQLLGWKGSAAALLGMLLPPIVILIIFATFFNDFREFPAVHSFLRGARPAIVALIALPCFQLWRSSGVTLSTVWIPVGAAICIGLLGVSPSLIILALVFLAVLYAIMVHATD